MFAGKIFPARVLTLALTGRSASGEQTFRLLVWVVSADGSRARERFPGDQAGGRHAEHLEAALVYCAFGAEIVPSKTTVASFLLRSNTWWPTPLPVAPANLPLPPVTM